MVAEETLSSSRGGAVLGNSQRCGKDKDSDKDNRGSLDGSTVPGPWIGKRIEFIPVEWFHSVRYTAYTYTCTKRKRHPNKVYETPCLLDLLEEETTKAIMCCVLFVCVVGRMRGS